MRKYCDILPKLLLIDERVRGLGAFVAYTVAWGDVVKADLSSEVSKLIKYLRSRYSIESLREEPVVRAYRKFFWSIGIDPTKTRPSAEALVRRVLRSNEFPRISPIVDAGNIASAYTLVPIGLYDMDKVKPPLRLTLSDGGEVFKPIGGKDEVLRPGIPVLKDASSRVLHIYPHRDSRETCVTEGTRRIVILAAGVPGVPRDTVVSAVHKVTELLGLLEWSSCNNVVLKT